MSSWVLPKFRSYYNCPLIKEVVSGPFLGYVRANCKRPPSEFHISRLLGDDCDAIRYILEASCLETCTWDLNLILTRLPGTMPPIPHVSHHEQHCIKVSNMSGRRGVPLFLPSFFRATLKCPPHRLPLRCQCPCWCLARKEKSPIWGT